jgi:hypothetical protein
MVRARTALEGTYLLARIIKIRRLLFVLQAVVFIILAIVLLVIGGATRDPLYIPIPSFLYLMLILFLLMTIEGFFFRIIEIRYNPSESRKFLMASNSIRAAILILIIAGVIGGILFFPGFQNYMEGRLSSTETLHAGNSHLMFTTQDRFALTNLDNVELSVNQDTADVYILTPENYRQFSENDDRSILRNSLNVDYTVPPSIIYSPRTETFSEYHIVYDSVAVTDSTIQVSCKFTVELSDTFTFIIPTICILLTISHALWVIYLIPIKKKYMESSIYV